MFDKTMLASGPAGTSMLGERSTSIDAAGRTGLERQARERESREEDAFGNLNEDGLPQTQTQTQTQKARHKDSGKQGQAQAQAQGQQLQFQNESAEGDYSDGPIHSRLERDGDGKKRGIWGRIARKLTGV